MKGDPHPWEAGRGPGTMCRSSSLFRWWSSWPSYDHHSHHDYHSHHDHHSHNDHHSHHMIIIAKMTIHHGHLDHHDYFDHSWKNADASVLFFKPVVIFVEIFCFFTCKKCFGLLCWQVEHKLWSKDLLFYAHCNMNSVFIMLVLSIHLVPRFFCSRFLSVLFPKQYIH